ATTAVLLWTERPARPGRRRGRVAAAVAAAPGVVAVAVGAGLLTDRPTVDDLAVAGTVEGWPLRVLAGPVAMLPVVLGVAGVGAAVLALDVWWRLRNPAAEVPATGQPAGGR